MNSIIEEVYEKLIVETEATNTDDLALLLSKVESACEEVWERRHYPETWTDAMILNDLSRYASVIRRVALFDYNQIGAEGQSVVQENGEYRSWVNRELFLTGVVAVSEIA